MDKERISAARKKLKEFQRNKKDQARKSDNEYANNPDANSQITSASSSPVTFQDGIQQRSQIKTDNGEFDKIQDQNSHESPHLLNDDATFNHVSYPFQENFNFSSAQEVHESTNGTVEIPQNSNFTPSHSRNESNSTVCSQIIHENVDHMQDLSMQKFQNINSELSITNNGVGLLQREHLLHMANAVADVLVDQKGLDESVLKNCDLEQRNQFLTCCLEEQKKIANQLHIQVSQCNSKISDLEAIIKTKDMEFESKRVMEVAPLKEQITLDAQTIGILVAEKAELTAANSQCQIAIKQKTEETIELSSKLKNLQQREYELERELSIVKSNLEEFAMSYQQLQTNYQEAVEKSSKLKKENEDFELEVSELRQKLNYKNTELVTLKQELQEKTALLSLSELRVQQLSSVPEEANALEIQHRTTKVMEQQLAQMKDALECLSGEKDEVSKKYQSYVQQLDERYSKMVTELEAARKVISDSEIREQSYIQRLSELEQQLQRDKDKASSKPVEDQTEKINVLTKSIDNLVLEQENFQSLLNEKDNEIELLKKELKELEEVKDQNVEASKLAEALQSEQLGASRAVSQNQRLKTQLDEMHDAFISLSNTKLNLTEQLQAERSIGKKLNAKLNEVEDQVNELKNQLASKESLIQELEKEKLQTAQIEDQIQHYQAQSHSSGTLQLELQKALATIESLKKENQILQSRGVADQDDTAKDTVSEEVSQTSPDTSDEIDTVKAEDITANVIEEVVTATQPLTSNEISSIPEPFKKLEKRFKETMEKVAELTDEKQRLEHLVLQLQGETETIGEYVSLYQKQRAILQNKAREKENTFRQLVEQRNQQQEQLHKLKVLVADLIKLKNSKATVPVATAAEENMPISSLPADNINDNVEVIDGYGNESKEVMYSADETTSQILDLLTEIKDCNNACTLEPNFHPCPWCSGKLITV